MRKNDHIDFAKHCFEDAAFALIKKKPLSKVSVSEICAEAGFSRASFYRYFDSPEAPLASKVRDITARYLSDEGNRFNFEHPRESVIILFHHLLDYKDIGLLFEKAGCLSIVGAEFERGFVFNHLKEEERLRWAFVGAGLFRVYSEWVKSGFDKSPESLAEILFGGEFPLLKNSQ